MNLIEFEANDHELIRDLDSDPEVVKFTSNGVPSDDTEVERVIAVILQLKQESNGIFGVWKAINKSTGEFMGWLHFRPLKSDPKNFKVIELGYRFKKEFWGQGFATEGSKALINKGFNELGVEEVWAHAMIENTASINVMKKCGLVFQREEIYDEWAGKDKRCVWYIRSVLAKK